MTKFVYQFEPNGKDFFIKADNLKEAKTKLKKTFGGLPYYVGETLFKSKASQPVGQFDYELAQL